LDYNNSFRAPIRGAVIEAVNASGDIIASGLSNPDGTYTLSVNSNTDMRLLVKAQLFSDETAKWNFSVTDNTQNNQLYVLQGSVYSAVQKFIDVNAAIDFPALELRWSINNKTQLGVRSEGRIGTSAYFPDEDGGVIYLLGEEGRDTDEFDPHVILHEWGHYFEHRLSRSDSIGGFHALNDRLDARVAFSEGWGNALSAIITGDPIYRDSAGTSQASGFSFNIEAGAASNPGWFNEASIGTIIYNVFGGSSDAASEDLAPLYNVMSSDAYKNSPVFTTIFALADGLRREIPSQAAALNNLLENQSISGEGPNGNGERNSGAIRSALPVYKEVSLNSGGTVICSVDDAGLFNKLGNREFVFLNLDAEREVQLSLFKISGNEDRDPDFNIWQGNQLIHEANSAVLGEEIFETRLPAGDYVIEVFDFLNTNGSGSRRGDSCYNLTVTG